MPNYRSCIRLKNCTKREQSQKAWHSICAKWPHYTVSHAHCYNCDTCDCPKATTSYACTVISPWKFHGDLRWRGAL